MVLQLLHGISHNPGTDWTQVLGQQTTNIWTSGHIHQVSSELDKNVERHADRQLELFYCNINCIKTPFHKKYSPLLTNPEELTACERRVQHAARTCLDRVETPPSFLSQASLATRRCRRPTGNSAVAANRENEKTVTAYWTVTVNWTAVDMTAQHRGGSSSAFYLWRASCATNELHSSHRPGVCSAYAQ